MFEFEVFCYRKFLVFIFLFFLSSHYVKCRPKTVGEEEGDGVISISEEIDFSKSPKIFDDYYQSISWSKNRRVDFHKIEHFSSLDKVELKFLLQLLQVLEDILNNNNLRFHSDDELMQSDQQQNQEADFSGNQRQIDGYQNETSASDNDRMMREEAKARRIHEIKKQILMFLGTSNPDSDVEDNGTKDNKQKDNGTKDNKMKDNGTTKDKDLSTGQQSNILRILYENSKNIPQWPSDSYMRKTQSFNPSCSLPKHTSKEEWFGGKDLNLYFNLTFPEPSPGTATSVLSSQLRLYKLPYEPSALSEIPDPDYELSQASPPAELQEAIQKSGNLPQNVADATILAAMAQEKQIRVSIYYYTRSLKKRRVKRTLVASNMLPLYGERWTEWNIKKAVNIWKNGSHKNYGISISVEDDEGSPLLAHKIFGTINCSNPINLAKPMPGFLYDAAHDDNVTRQIKSSNESVVNEWNRMNLTSVQYPMLELTVIEIPKSQVNNAFLFHYTKSALDQRVSDHISGNSEFVEGIGNMYNNENPYHHRIRHHHRKFNGDVEAEGPISESNPDRRLNTDLKPFPINSHENITSTSTQNNEKT